MTISASDKIAIRQKIVQLATNELGSTDPRLYWYTALGGVAPTAAQLKLAWCGIFANAMLLLAGATTRRWVAGVGFIYSKRPYPTTTKSPLPGDIVYVDQPYQHYAIVTDVDSDGTIHGIGGNTPSVARQQFNPAHVAVFSIDTLLNTEARISAAPAPGAPTTPPSAPKSSTGPSETLPAFTATYDALVHDVTNAGFADAAHKAATLLAIAGVETGGVYESRFSTARAAYFQRLSTTEDQATAAQKAAATKNEYAASTSHNLHGTQFAGDPTKAVEFIDFFYAIDHHADGSPYVARFRRFPNVLASHRTTLDWLMSKPTSKSAMATCAPYPVIVRSMKADHYFEGDVTAYTAALLRHATIQYPYLMKSAAAIASPFPRLFDPLGVATPSVYWFVGQSGDGSWGDTTLIRSKEHSLAAAQKTLPSVKPTIATAPHIYASARYPGAPGWTAIGKIS